MNKIFNQKWTKALIASVFALTIGIVVFAFDFITGRPDIGAIDFTSQQASMRFDQMGKQSITFTMELDAANRSGGECIIWVYYGLNNADSVYFYNGVIDSFMVQDGQTSVTKTIPFTSGSKDEYTLYFVPSTGVKLLGMDHYKFNTIMEDVYCQISVDKTTAKEGDELTFTIKAVTETGVTRPLFHNTDTTYISFKLNDLQAAYTDKNIKNELLFEVPPSHDSGICKLKINSHIGSQWRNAIGQELNIDKPTTTIKLFGGLPNIKVMDNDKLAEVRLAQVNYQATTKPGKKTPFILTFIPVNSNETLYSAPLIFGQNDFKSVGGTLSGELLVNKNLSGYTSYIYQQSDWMDKGTMSLTLSKNLEYGLFYNNNGISTTIETEVEPYIISLSSDSVIYEGQNLVIRVKADDVFGLSKKIPVVLEGKAIPNGYLVKEIDFLDAQEQIVFEQSIDTKLGEQAWGEQKISTVATKGINSFSAKTLIEDKKDLTYFDVFFSSSPDTKNILSAAGRQVPFTIKIDSERSLVKINNSDSIFALPLICSFTDPVVGTSVTSVDTVYIPKDATTVEYVYTIPTAHVGSSSFYVIGGGLDGVMANQDVVPVIKSTIAPTDSVEIEITSPPSVYLMGTPFTVTATRTGVTTTELSVPLRYDTTRFATGSVTSIIIPAGESSGSVQLTPKLDWTYATLIPLTVDINYTLDPSYRPDMLAPLLINVEPLPKVLVNTMLKAEGSQSGSSSLKLEQGVNFSAYFETTIVEHYADVLGRTIQLIPMYSNSDFVIEKTVDEFTLTYDATIKKYVSNEPVMATKSYTEYVPEQVADISFKTVLGTPGANVFSAGSKAMLEIYSDLTESGVLSIKNPVRINNHASYIQEDTVFVIKLELENSLKQHSANVLISFSDSSYFTEFASSKSADTVIYIAPFSKAGELTLTVNKIPKFQGVRMTQVSIAETQTVNAPILNMGIIDSPLPFVVESSNATYQEGQESNYSFTLNEEFDNDTPIEVKLITSNESYYEPSTNPNGKIFTLSKAKNVFELPIKFVKPATNDYYEPKTLTLSFDKKYADSYGYDVSEKIISITPEEIININLIPSATVVYEEGTLRLTYQLAADKRNLSGKNIDLMVTVPAKYFINGVDKDNIARISIAPNQNAGYIDLTLTHDAAQYASGITGNKVIFDVFPQNASPAGLSVDQKFYQIEVLRGMAALSMNAPRSAFVNVPYVITFNASKVMTQKSSFFLGLDPDIWGIASKEIFMPEGSSTVSDTLYAKRSAIEGTSIEIKTASAPFFMENKLEKDVIVYDNVPQLEWVATSSTVEEGKIAYIEMIYKAGDIPKDGLIVPMLFNGSLPYNYRSIKTEFFKLTPNMKPGDKVTMEIKTLDNQIYEPDYFLTITPFADVNRYLVPDVSYYLKVKEKNTSPSVLDGVGFTSVQKLNVIATQTVMKSFVVLEPTLIKFTVSGKGIVPSEDFEIRTESGSTIEPISKNTYIFNTTNGRSIFVSFKNHMAKVYSDLEVTLIISSAKSTNDRSLKLDPSMKRAIISFKNISPTLIDDFAEYTTIDFQNQDTKMLNVDVLANDKPAFTAYEALSHMVISGLRISGTEKLDSQIILPENGLKLFLKSNNKLIGVDTTHYRYSSLASTVFIDYEVTQANGGSSIAQLSFTIAPVKTYGSIVDVKSPANSGSSVFTKRPSLYGSYYDLVKDINRLKPRKLSLKVLSKISARSPVSVIDVLMGKTVKLYDAKKLAAENKSGKFSADVLNTIQFNRTAVNFYSDVKINHVKVPQFFTSVLITPPTIDTFIVPKFFVNPIVDSKNTIADSTQYICDAKGVIGVKITGNYFGNKPKAYLEYAVTSSNGRTSIKRISLSALKSYKDNFGKKVLIPAATDYNENTYFWVKMPKSMPANLSRVDLIIDTQSNLGGLKRFPIDEIKEMSYSL